MLSKIQQKNVRALSQKKYRDEQKCFIAEGEKLISDLLPYMTCRHLFVTEKCSANFSEKTLQRLSADEMKRISQLTTPSTALAVFEKPAESLQIDTLREQLVLVLDAVQNPGNLGTIIRLADWFGIHHVVCSHTTADVFSPKTVQATMGALTRVQVHYTDLVEFLTQCQQQNMPIYGTTLDGQNLYEQSLTAHGVLIMGNEGKGISSAVGRFITHHLFIPNYPQGVPTSESLNVAVATAIVCAEFRRRCQ
ncbi:MAG: TrmH family RNA methyltransferase [Paludibacteraceae bacterium]